MGKIPYPSQDSLDYFETLESRLKLYFWVYVQLREQIPKKTLRFSKRVSKYPVYFPPPLEKTRDKVQKLSLEG